MYQSLEFVVETRILVEKKIKNTSGPLEIASFFH